MAPQSMSVESSEASSLGTSSGDASPRLVGTDPVGKAHPIAICGMACKLPGDTTSASKFWDLLANCRSAQGDIPKSRFNIDGFYHPNGGERPGSLNTKGGYFIDEEIRDFENSFFGINNLEATHMDPQQRKLLEVVFECFESAGVPLDKVSGSNTGCYVGNFTIDHQVTQMKDPEYLSRYTATGIGTTILGNRISHVFNMSGPSLVLDTACSSSLYCLHMACAALESGECDAAIVAGANLVQSPEQHIGTMKAGVLSATSTCHSFDSSADGYGRADGVSALYIKRLEDAIRDGDPVRSVVRGSAVNSNGKTAGITLPSADGQEAVIRKAYAKAGLGFSQTTYVECHGTGTKVGDVIEVEGLSRVFKRLASAPLLIGSVKSNLGHSEAASGISSVIKTTLALEHSAIPGTFGLNEINPKLNTKALNIEIPTLLTPWPVETSNLRSIRRAGINSFGYGGANAHVILENADAYVPCGGASRLQRSLGRRDPVLLPISAATRESLDARVKDFADFDFHDASILDLAHTLGSRRTHFSKRGYLLVQSDTFIERGLTTQELHSIPGPASSGTLPYAFVFTGQGAQWPEMCKELIIESPVFRDAISELDATLQSLPHPPMWTLREAILEKPSISKLDHATRSQPACIAIQIALVQLLASWDIRPSATLGHSSGEIAAAFAAGYLSSAAAITIAYYRGYVVGKHVSQGAMMAAGISEDKASAEIAENGLQRKIGVACVNSPESVTISGDELAIDTLTKVFEMRGIFNRKLKTGGQAYHSHHMKVLGQEYQILMERALPDPDMSYRLPTGPLLVSSVTGELLSSEIGPAYWRSNLESQVQFSRAVERLSKEGDFHLIEVGPHSALELPIKQIRSKLEISSEKMPYSAAIKRNANSLESVIRLAGSLWLYGHDIAFSKVNGLYSDGKWTRHAQSYEVLHDLPKYQWHYDGLLWNECRASVEFRQRKHTRHELLGSQIPGGNGLDFTWRNILRVDDISWLRDHKLEETVVFPGAGYLASAIEAVTQASGSILAVGSTIRLNNVNILTALTLSTEPSASTELFTTLRRSQITYISASSHWWDFNISSFQNAISIPHACGSISIQTPSVPMMSKYQAPADALEPNVSRMWYDKLNKQGLNFGPTFQSIKEFQVPRMKSLKYCAATLPILQTCGDEWASYPVHPVTLDAMFQTSIVATSAGNAGDLRAKVPTRIGTAIIEIPKSSSFPGSICSQAEGVGFGAASVGVELLDSNDCVIVQFDDVRLAPYNVTTQMDVAEKRHPMLRVLWKPDIHGLGLISSDRLSDYLDGFLRESHSAISDEGLLKLGATLSLLAHKSSSLRVLELGNDSKEITKAAMGLLGSNTSFKMFRSYTVGSISEHGELFGAEVNPDDDESQAVSQITGQTFDLVFLPLLPTADAYLEERLETIKGLMEQDSLLLAVSGAASHALTNVSKMELVRCQTSDGTAQIILARAPNGSGHDNTLSGRRCIVVDRSRNELSEVTMGKLAEVSGQPVTRLAIDEVTEKSIAPGAIVFCLFECQTPTLSTATDEEMACIKHITNNASDIVWVTAGNVLEGTKPDFALVSGIARALVLEQPSVRFFTFDIDDASSQVQQTAEHLVSVLNQRSNPVDKEFVQQRGVVHVSRYVPDDALNDSFRQQQGIEMVEMSLEEAKPAKLFIEKPGQFDTIYFKQLEFQKVLDADAVQIQVKTVGLNASDFDVLAGKADTINATCSLEFCGIVERVGGSVTDFSAGDRVVAMAPSPFQTSQIVPQWACQQLQDDEDFNTLSTIPIGYATAIYALHDRAHIQDGETILIHSGADGVGMAAIRIAMLAGAEVFTTVSTEAKKDYVVKIFGMKPSNVFSSRDAAFLPSILEATNGKGVDVILNSLTGDLLHASWRCCGSFGRFVELGQRDLISAGRLEMDQFLRNVTFTALDMSSLYNADNPALHAIWSRLLTDVLRLYREKKLMRIEPLEAFDVSNIAQALRSFSSGDRLGKIAINLENGPSVLQVQPSKYTTKFSLEKSYIMVGCLGGLGRSLSKWMMARGARKFVFLGRSGLDKAPARRLIQDLERNGADCKVVRGNVCSRTDIDKVVEQVEGFIGGVVQAAMGLNEALFTMMPNEYWHTGIDPKVAGTWNLHNAIKGKDSKLEFFLMTSSISGTVGTATESNYCAANYFLDIFARHRRSLGLPATSIGLGMISEVGYLHENPEIEALLLRKGIQAINEDEFLQIVDIALFSTSTIPHAYDALAHAHVLTGLEPFGLKELRKKGFEGTNPALDDPRAAILAAALYGQADVAYQNQEGNLPTEVVEALEMGTPLAEAIVMHVTKRFGNLVLLPLAQVDAAKPLAEYGMDSMIAAEFRTWFFQAFKVDIPFLTLLSKITTVRSLSDAVVAEVTASKGRE